MVQVLIDAVVLVFLLKVVNDDDIGFGTAALLALFTSILAFALALFLFGVMGPWGVVVAALIVAGALGFAIAALFGVELKRALGVAAAFMVIHVGVSLGLRYLLS